MNASDLKVVRASVYVSNEDAEVKDYLIGANFNTNLGKLENVNSGNVSKDGKTYAAFYTGYGMEQSTTISYYNEANDDEDVRCEINNLVYEFIKLATSKVYQEIKE